MPLSKNILRALGTTLMLALLVAGTGCTDAFTGLDEAEPTLEANDGPTFRHAHLLDRATTRTTSSPGKKGGGGNGGGTTTDTGLIFTISPQSVLEPYRVLERYRLIERFRVLERYEYEYVFDGYAIWADADNAADLIAAMELDPDIASVEPDIYLGRLTFPNGLESGNGQLVPWGTDRIGATGASAQGVDLFVIDTGVSNADIPVTQALDFRENANDAADYDGHGTHVAGLIAAANDGDGLLGVAPDVNLHSLKVLNGDEFGDSDEVELAAVLAAVEYVTMQKILNPNTPTVVNFSLGADIGTTEYNALDLALDAAIANGVTVVIAAGNQGIDASTVTPAHVASAITVGAYDGADLFAGFSNHGPLVDILAPGTTLPSLWTENGSQNGYPVLSGTSQAAALVSGAVARFLSENPNASPQQVRDALVESARTEISNAPSGTTNETVHVGGLMAMQVPPFFQYALTVNSNVALDMGSLHVGIEPGGNALVNANLFVNGNINVARNGHLVEGFAYHAGNMDGRNNRINSTFVPNYNPTGEAVHHNVAPIDVPIFDAAQHQGVTTQVTTGNLTLSGHYDLGTAENPVIWYVSGNINTAGAATFSGYGVFMAEGNITVSHDLTTVTGAGESTVGFYTNGNLTVLAQNLTLHGQIFANGNVIIGAAGDQSTIYGSITTGGNPQLEGTFTLYYRPASSVLTEPLWPMNGGQ